MRFDGLLHAVNGQPVIESAMLRAFGEEPKKLAVQLSRWVKSGKLVQLRRGVYLLAKPYRHVTAPLAFVANLLATPSYVSCEYALALHGLIPERTHLVQSVTTGRTAQFDTPIGAFEYRHVAPKRFFGYAETPVEESRALVAHPEKALLDLAYVSKEELTIPRIEQLRLQDLSRFDLGRLTDLAGRMKSPRLVRAAGNLASWIQREREAEVTL